MSILMGSRDDGPGDGTSSDGSDDDREGDALAFAY